MFLFLALLPSVLAACDSGQVVEHYLQADNKMIAENNPLVKSEHECAQFCIPSVVAGVGTSGTCASAGYVTLGRSEMATISPSPSEAEYIIHHKETCTSLNMAALFGPKADYSLAAGECGVACTPQSVIDNDPQTFPGSCTSFGFKVWKKDVELTDPFPLTMPVYGLDVCTAATRCCCKGGLRSLLVGAECSNIAVEGQCCYNAGSTVVSCPGGKTCSASQMADGSGTCDDPAGSGSALVGPLVGLAAAMVAAVVL